jgi:hypothetical protein
MLVHRPGRDVEEVGDLPVLLSLRDEGEHLAPSGRQAVLGGGEATRRVRSSGRVDEFVALLPSLDPVSREGAYKRDPRVDAYIDALPPWQGRICQQLRDLYDRPYEVEAAEPEVPLQHMVWGEFEASSPFDVICLARSPDYTPVELDPLFDEICQRFIDEAAFR